VVDVEPLRARPRRERDWRGPRAPSSTALPAGTTEAGRSPMASRCSVRPDKLRTKAHLGPLKHRWSTVRTVDQRCPAAGADPSPAHRFHRHKRWAGVQPVRPAVDQPRALLRAGEQSPASSLRRRRWQSRVRTSPARRHRAEQAPRRPSWQQRRRWRPCWKVDSPVERFALAQVQHVGRHRRQEGNGGQRGRVVQRHGLQRRRAVSGPPVGDRPCPRAETSE
jgi:hypothetical protein